MPTVQSNADYPSLRLFLDVCRPEQDDSKLTITIKYPEEPSVVAQVCNPSTWGEHRKSGVESQPQLRSGSEALLGYMDSCLKIKRNETTTIKDL